MKNAGEVMAEIIINNMVAPDSSKKCSICGVEVPALKVEIPGMNINRWVQPKCKCEVERNEAERRAFEKRTEELELRKLFSISDLGEKLINSSFDAFQTRQGSDMAFKASKRYSDMFNGKNPTALMLWGNPGNGKSMLAACVNNEVRKKGFTTIFVSMPDLLKKIKATFNNGSKESESEILRALDICDLLVIDDLGAEKTSDWVEETVFAIIDSRYRKKKPIFITSNIEPSQLANKIGSRSMDRIIEMCIEVKNEASSYRQYKAQQMKEQMLKKMLEN